MRMDIKEQNPGPYQETGGMNAISMPGQVIDVRELFARQQAGDADAMKVAGAAKDDRTPLVEPPVFIAQRIRRQIQRAGHGVTFGLIG